MLGQEDPPVHAPGSPLSVVGSPLIGGDFGIPEDPPVRSGDGGNRGWDALCAYFGQEPTNVFILGIVTGLRRWLWENNRDDLAPLAIEYSGFEAFKEHLNANWETQGPLYYEYFEAGCPFGFQGPLYDEYFGWDPHD
jgi:hypothetical protein